MQPAKYVSPNMKHIRFLTIHCAATPEGRDVKAATVSQWDEERFKRKLPSYHWVIELDGTAVQTLADGLEGCAVLRSNSNNIHVSYIGGMSSDMKHDKDTRIAAQNVSLARLIKQYQAKYPGIAILGHYQWPSGKVEGKTCPNFNVPKWLRDGMPATYEENAYD